MKTTRMAFLASAGLAAAILGCSAGHAAAPQVKTQAPGFYRMMLGDFEITALNDGVVAYPTAHVLPGATAEQIKQGLADSGLKEGFIRSAEWNNRALGIERGSRIGTKQPLSDADIRAFQKRMAELGRMGIGEVLELQRALGLREADAIRDSNADTLGQRTESHSVKAGKSLEVCPLQSN